MSDWICPRCNEPTTDGVVCERCWTHWDERVIRAWSMLKDDLRHIHLIRGPRKEDGNPEGHDWAAVTSARIALGVKLWETEVVGYGKSPNKAVARLEKAELNRFHERFPDILDGATTVLPDALVEINETVLWKRLNNWVDARVIGVYPTYINVIAPGVQDYPCLCMNSNFGRTWKKK